MEHQDDRCFAGDQRRRRLGAGDADAARARIVALAVVGFGVWRLLHIRVLRYLLYHYGSWFFALWFQGWLDGAVSALRPLLGQTPDPPSPPMEFSQLAEVALYMTPVSVLVWFFVTRKDRLKR